MQLQDLKRIKHRGGTENCFCFFPFLKKITEIWQKALETALRKRCSEVCFGLEIWGVLDSTKSGHIDKIRCSVKRFSSCMGYWRVLDYNVERKLQATWQNKICILVKIYVFFWDNMAFLRGISLFPEKKALFFSILQKQTSRGVLYKRCS